MFENEVELSAGGMIPHLLERHYLVDALFQPVGEYLPERGLRIASGTIVDASIISTPRSTKNMSKSRDPEMHKTRID